MFKWIAIEEILSHSQTTACCNFRSETQKFNLVSIQIKSICWDCTGILITSNYMILPRGYLQDHNPARIGGEKNGCFLGFSEVQETFQRSV